MIDAATIAGFIVAGAVTAFSLAFAFVVSTLSKDSDEAQ